MPQFIQVFCVGHIQEHYDRLPQFIGALRQIAAVYRSTTTDCCSLQEHYDRLLQFIGALRQIAAVYRSTTTDCCSLQEHYDRLPQFIGALRHIAAVSFNYTQIHKQNKFKLGSWNVLRGIIPAPREGKILTDKE